MRKLTKDSFINGGIAAAIVAVTAAVYGQVHDFEFLNYDDNVYVTENPYVANGVTWDGVVAAFTKPQNAGWNPVTTLTHMIDVDLFGLNPGPPHIINVLFHCSNTVVLFFLLLGMTGARWPSAFVAALFALHPLHVEPVAWVSSRKDVLSMHFMLLTIRFYLRYVKTPSWKWSVLTVLHFLTALLAKPMVVTLPVLLLLLDYWPLRRLADASPILAEKRRAALRLVREKIPLFLCSAVICIITLLVQGSGGAVRTLDEYTWYERFGNAIVSYIVYIGVTIWPVRLVPYYPHPGAWPVLTVLGAAGLLLFITAVALLRVRKSPYLLVGWGWWLVSLLPVIGIIQIGSFARADRFTYLPHIGLFIVFTWGIEELTRRVPQRKSVLTACAIVLFVPAIAVTYNQVGHWRNTISLFEYVLTVSPENAVAHNNLGIALLTRADAAEAPSGDLAQAEEHLRNAVRLAPAYVDAYNNLGVTLQRQGKEGAGELFEKALALDPNDPDALQNAARAQLQIGAIDDAVAKFRRASELVPEDADAHYNLAIALTQQGQVEEGVAEFRKTVELKPDDAVFRAGLANGLLRINRVPAAAEQALEGVKLDPENADAHYNLGVALYTMGRKEDAIEELQQAVELEPDFLDAHLNLAGVLANENRTEEAMHHFKEMLRIHPGDERAVRAIEILEDRGNEDQPETNDTDAPL